jgi:hypothetical protein
LSRAIAILTGKTGHIYDPSSLRSVWQDSAGTVAGALESPTGKLGDLSASANHTFQATAAARPALSSRVNLLLNSCWSGGGAVPTGGWFTDSNTGVSAPNGSVDGNTVYRFTEVAQRYIFRAPFAQSLVAGGSFTASVRVGVIYSGSISAENILLWVVRPADALLYYYRNGVVVSGSVLVATGDVISTQVRYVGTAGNVELRVGAGTAGPATVDIDLSRPQIEVGNTATRYQRINTATDYDTAGFPVYEKFDGIDDNLASATGGGGTTGFFWCGAVKPTGGFGVSRNLFEDSGSNTGYKVQLDAGNALRFLAGNGTAYTNCATAATTSVGSTALLTVWDDFANLNVQVGDGAIAQVARPVVAAGTAGYRISTTSGGLNGHLYASVYVKNSGLTAAERNTIKAFVRGKAGL